MLLKELDRIKNLFEEKYELMDHIMNTDLYISDKHSLIFNSGCSKPIFEIIQQYDLEFDYSDYNGSMENDLNRFVNAVKNKLELFKEVNFDIDELPEEANKQEKILHLIKELNIVNDSKLSDSDKYSLIFSDLGSTEFFKQIKDNYLSFDYYDPDTTYAEDVQAFIDAVNSRAKDIKKIMYKPKKI